MDPTQMNLDLHSFSVGRCVILCAFLGKSVKHTFSCKKCILFKKKMFPFFSCSFNVMVTSQSDVPIFD